MTPADGYKKIYEYKKYLAVSLLDAAIFVAYTR